MQGQLGLEGVPRKLVRVTPARLATWTGCPRRYRMTYLDRPAPARAGAWAHSTLGAVIHNVLRALLELPASGRTPQRAVSLLHRHWKSDGFSGPDQAARYRRRAAGWLTGYAEQLDAQARPVALERWVSAQAGTIIAEGRVDRVDERDGELVVIDYKTGRRALSAEDARDSQALGLYALAVGRNLHRRCRVVELHHLPSGKVLRWEHDERSLAGHLERAERSAAELQEATDSLTEGSAAEELFPPRPGRHCSWCDFRAHCPEGRRAAPEVPPWSLLGD